MNAIVESQRISRAALARRRNVAVVRALRRARVMEVLSYGAKISLDSVAELLNVKSATARGVIRALAREGAIVLEPLHALEPGKPRMTWVLAAYAYAQLPRRKKARKPRPPGPRAQRRQQILDLLNAGPVSSHDIAHLFSTKRGKVSAAATLRVMQGHGLLTSEYEAPTRKRGAPRLLYRRAESTGGQRP